MKYLYLFILSGVFYLGNAQNKETLDSIMKVLTTKVPSDTSNALLYQQIMIFSSDPNLKELYADTILRFEKLQPKYYIIAWQQKGVSKRLNGDLKNGLKFLFHSAKLAEEHKQLLLLAECYGEIGTTYSINLDIQNALKYENKSIDILRQLGKEYNLAIALLNTGYTYYEINKYDTANQYYNEAKPIFDSLNLTIGQAYVIGNRALVYWKTGKIELAKEGLLRAIDLLKPLGDQFGMSDYHNQLGNLYWEQGNLYKAKKHLNIGLDMALELDLKEQIRDASLLLSKIYASTHEYQKAYDYQLQHLAYKDSIQSKETTNAMADLRTEYEVNLREKEITTLEKDKQLQQTYIIIAIILVALLLIAMLYFRQRLRTSRLLIQAERHKNNARIKDLLRNHETETLQAMVNGKEEERKHLAKELHNHLGSLLATVKVNLNGLKSTNEEKQQTIVNLVDQACQDIRNISHELNMGVSENFGLVPALSELVRHLKKVNGLAVEFTASLDHVYINAQSEILLYRITQELISNVLKHANASELSITLTGYEEDNLVNILVEDNGDGFESENVEKASKGIGLDSLNDIVQKLDGELIIDSRTGMGTTINIDLPVPKPETIIEP
ncbi:tetratricopeptide repeat-containing sensor histidine kinase [Reichenbachiella versicolor]|uniref:tetratricopeptide repeat-containing sensor histidine kinase n=1 Tax=Reichenbachiella versicolor TaxID=1821036 RepID=UPI0013A54CBF|nr:ATP-binding protein [Reichenbachiella versicolor]